MVTGGTGLTLHSRSVKWALYYFFFRSSKISFVWTNCFLRVQSNFKNEIWVQNSLTLLRQHKVGGALNQNSFDTSVGSTGLINVCDKFSKILSLSLLFIYWGLPWKISTWISETKSTTTQQMLSPSSRFQSRWELVWFSDSFGLASRVHGMETCLSLSDSGILAK